MQQTREQKKAKLAQMADELIEALLDWDETHDRPNLTQIEDEVLRLRRRFGQGAAEIIVSGQAAEQPVEPVCCLRCGGAMRTKGRKRKAVESRAGEFGIERGYYYCDRCRSGFFPPGQPTGAE